MALTTEQLADFQADLGIDDSQAVFTDAALERLFVRAGEVYETAVWYAWRQLLAASTAYVDYQVAQTKVSRSQVHAHIKEMVAYWGDESDRVNNTQGVQILGLNEIPTKWKEEPYIAESERNRQYRRSSRCR